MFTDPRVQVGGCDLRLGARQPARSRVDHLKACRPVIPPSQGVELGVKPRGVQHTLGCHRAERDPRGVDRHAWRRHRLEFGLRVDIGVWSQDTDAHGRLPAVALPLHFLSHKGATSFPKGGTRQPATWYNATKVTRTGY